MPKSLHRKLVEAAERDGVSLNQWINTTLAAAAGDGAARTSPRHELKPEGQGIFLK